MTKVINPLMSQDARGSVAGVQYSRNRSGNFGSRKSTTNRSQSECVTAHRALIKRAHARWVAIPQALRDQWQEYAPPTIGGRPAFIGAQIRNYTLGPADLSVSPLTHYSRPRINDMSVKQTSMGPDRISLIWDAHATDSDVVILYACFPRGPTMQHVRKFKYLDFATPDDETISSPLAYVRPFCCVRIIWWDHVRGVTIQEWRALLIGETPVQITEDW